jgi:hypothetical protein
MTQNPYFTYITGTKPGGDQYAHRTDVQEWVVHHNAVKLTIYVQGPLPSDQHNAFAKKHLMTTTGGDHDGSPRGKLTAISSKRRTDTIASTNQARQDKLAELTAFAPKDAAQYNAANAYGANGIGIGTPLTMIHCDAVTPTKLKEAFATAILAIKSNNWQDQGVPPQKVAHTNVRFKENIIYNQLYSKNDITTTNRMSVMVMKDKLINTYHVFHGAPYDGTYPNAGT